MDVLADVLTAAGASPHATGVFLVLVAAVLMYAGGWEFHNNWEMVGLATMVLALVIGVVGIKTALTGEMW
jgi:membrane protein YdbS with pleckstrin-like domain